MCEAKRNTSSQKRTAHCHVNHSSNTVPALSCPSLSASVSTAVVTEIRSDVRQVRVRECAYEKLLYNITSFTVHTEDNTPLTCTARYTTAQNLSAVYYEEQFVVFHALNKTQTTDNAGQCEFLELSFQ